MLLLCAAVTACPTALADGVSFMRLEFDSPQEATARILSIGEGEDAAGWRETVDSDDDGTVTQEEVDAHEEQYREFLDAEYRRSSSEIVGATYTLDDAAPSSRLDAFEFKGAVGAVTSTAPVTMEIRLTYTWNVTPADMTFELMVPPGYRIADTSDIPGAMKFSSDRRLVNTTLTLQADHDFSMTFERAVGKDLPGVGALAALASVILGLCWRARRG